VTSIVPCPACGKRNRVPAAATGRPRCAACRADLPWLVTQAGSDLGASIDASPLPVLVDCWAPWCGPCRMVGPIVDSLAERYAGKLKVVKVNVDEEPQLAARFGVQGIPALFLLREGEVVDEIVGAVPERTLTDHVERVLASAA
jgi:thioredoxin 2